MPREIRMPKLSDTMEEGRINVWRKREGERIAKGEVLLEVETDKADMEYEAYVAGTLARILVPSGETVAVGTPIAVVRLDRDTDEDLRAFLAGGAAAGGALPGAAPGAAPAAPPPAPEATTAAPRSPHAFAAPSPPPRASAPAHPLPATGAARPGQPTPPPSAAPEPSRAGRAPEPAPVRTAAPPEGGLPFAFPDPDRVRATPRARVLARERGADLTEIAGSGPGGAVLVPDVERWLAAVAEAPAPAAGDVPATPVAERIATELGVDLARVTGTGPGGRVTKRDLREHLARTPREPELYGDEIRLSQKRKFLVRSMVESKRTAPHFYVSMEVDAEPLAALRGRLRDGGRRATLTHLVARASVLALERHPEVNATYREDRIVRFNPIHLAVAVHVGDELVAPVVRHCQGRGLDDLAQALDAQIEKARQRKLQPDDYSGGTFTISNLGMFGVDRFYAIITPPQSTVLSLGRVRREPVVDGERVRPGQRMSLGLAVDHRVLDGVKAAQFLAELRGLLEAPDALAAAAEERA